MRPKTAVNELVSTNKQCYQDFREGGNLDWEEEGGEGISPLSLFFA